MSAKHAFLLVGSPRGTKSSSHVLGGRILARLEAEGWTSSEMSAVQALHSPEAIDRLVRSATESDLVVVAFPLYVDQLPAPLVRACEILAERKAAVPRRETRPRLAAVVNCGFPEASQNRFALEIVRRFADEAGFEWAGGLALGMGGAIGGQPLEKAGGMVRNAVRSLDLAAASLARGETIPAEAVELMAKPAMPAWFYLAYGNISWRLQARKHKVWRKLHDRPYA